MVRLSVARRRGYGGAGGHTGRVDWWQVLLGVVGGLLLLWAVLLLVLWRVRPDGTSTSAALRLLPDLVRLLRRLAADRSLPRGVRVRLWLLLANPKTDTSDFQTMKAHPRAVVVRLSLLGFPNVWLGEYVVPGGTTRGTFNDWIEDQ